MGAWSSVLADRTRRHLAQDQELVFAGARLVQQRLRQRLSWVCGRVPHTGLGPQTPARCVHAGTRHPAGAPGSRLRASPTVESTGCSGLAVLGDCELITGA